MIPNIDILDSIEMIRDGGSLALCFSSKQTEFWLLLRVQFNADKSERLGYSKPFLVNRTAGLETSLSWESASSLLAQSYHRNLNEHSKKWLLVMEKVIKSKGALPSEVKKNVGPWRKLSSSHHLTSR